MKFPYLLAALAVVSSANAAVTVHKDVSIGMDAAIVEAFNEIASKQAIDDTGVLQLDRVKDAVSSVKLNGENFEITFDETKISSVLRDSGIACWSGLSEPVLVWMTDVSSQDSSIISADSSSFIMKSLIDDAKSCQYNLLFPLMDLDDLQNVNDQTVLSHSDKLLAKASARYGVKFFISAALEKNSEVEEQVTFKWNVFDDQGKILGNGENTGSVEEISKSATKDIAKILMNNTIDSQAEQGSNIIPLTSADEQQTASAVAQEEDLSLGPVKGGVRVLFTGIDNVADYPAISKTLVMYGYESDVNVLAYQDSGVVFMIPTGSSPLILDGTLSHAGEFTKIAPWTYKYNKSHGSVSADSKTGTVTKTTEQIITTDIDKYNGQAYTTSTVERTTEITQEEVVPAAKSNVTLTDDLEYSDNRKGSLGN